MGCLNSNKNFDHRFGNIHLSGPCNRSCYFCIGQHMMGQDGNNNLNVSPLLGLDEFIEKCLAENVIEINLTGTNTDPSLYKHTEELCRILRERIPGVILGIRTNGVLLRDIQYFDKGSYSITSTDPDVYEETMGGKIPSLTKMHDAVKDKPWKINIVLTPQGLPFLGRTIKDLTEIGFTQFNLREPYGQENIGNPFEDMKQRKIGEIFGMPQYEYFGATITYWDVHYVEVESINLYADGRISHDYPVSRGHAENGFVLPQSEFEGHKRRNAQWVTPTIEQKHRLDGFVDHPSGALA